MLRTRAGPSPCLGVYADHTSPGFAGGRSSRRRYFSAYGLIGVPTARVTGSGGATSRKA